jgi:hypothetical protein
MGQIILHNVSYSGRVVWGVSVDRSDTGIVGSNPAQVMDVYLFRILCSVTLHTHVYTTFFTIV